MSTQIARRRELTPAQKTKELLDSRKDEFARALAGRVDPEAFVRVAYATITKSPKLLEATPASLLMALLEAASLGLTPNGILGEAYIVPFNNKVKGPQGDYWEVQAQFIPGYRGLIKLARQSGVIKNIVPRAVYNGDRFEIEYGLTEKLIHVPNLDIDQSKSTLTHVYAVAHFVDGTTQFEVMSKAQVESIRSRSKSKDNGPWANPDDYIPMGLKSVIRRIVKYLPLSDFDLARAIEADDRVIGAADIDNLAIHAAPALTATRTERVLEKVKQTRAIAAPASVEIEEDDGGDPEFAPAVQDLAARVEAGEFDQAEGEAEVVEAREVVDLTADDGPELDEFESLLDTLELSGGDVSQRQRNELAKLGDAIYGAGTDNAVGVRKIADNPDLGRAQVTKFLAAGRKVVEARAKQGPAAAGVGADAFGEEG